MLEMTCETGMMGLQTCNPSTWEAEAGGYPVGEQPGVHSKSLKKQNNKKESEIQIEW
jgi:hypothetical protein